MGCNDPVPSVVAGKVTSIEWASSASSARPLRLRAASATAASRPATAALIVLPASGRSAGGSVPIERRTVVISPLRPRKWTRTASRAA